MKNERLKTALNKIKQSAERDIKRLETRKVKLLNEINAIETEIDNKAKTVNETLLIQAASKSDSASEKYIDELILNL